MIVAETVDEASDLAEQLGRVDDLLSGMLV
jgi:hypothetical protein